MEEKPYFFKLYLRFMRFRFVKWHGRDMNLMSSYKVMMLASLVLSQTPF